MARTTRQIIERALRLIGVLAAGETADADDANDSLLTLNQMLDTWSADSLLVYQIDEASFALTAGVRTYTIGTGGAFSTPRPVAVQYAYVRDSTGVDRPVLLVTQDEYAGIPLKSSPNSYPEALFYDQSYPLGEVNLYPAPLANLTLYLGVWRPFTEIADLDTTFAFPPGYEFALTYSLAELLAVEYSRPVPDAVGRAASQGRARIQSVNLPEVFATCEFGGVGAGEGMTLAQFLRGF